jgi:hypothetical protein
VLALIHHPDDAFTNTQTNVGALSRDDRKAAHKNLTVVQFTGTLPAPPVVMPVRIHNASRREPLLTNVILSLNGYPGRVRLVSPQVKSEGDQKAMLVGIAVTADVKDIRRWATSHLGAIAQNQKSKQPYDRTWSKQRINDVR